MSAKKSKKQVKPLGFTESFKEIVTGVGTSLKDDVATKLPKLSFAQLVGIDPLPSGHDAHAGGHDSQAEEGHGDSHAAESHGGEHKAKEGEKITTLSGILNPGEWLNLAHITGSSEHTPAPAEKPAHNPNIAPAIDYHREIATASETSLRRKDAQMERKFAEIKEELNRMVASSNKIVQEQFGGVTLEQAPTDVGDYHLNVLDWMLIAIRTARQKVEDSGAWLAAMRGKKGKKNGGMLLDAQKSGNTSVSMSNERQVATQTG